MQRTTFAIALALLTFACSAPPPPATHSSRNSNNGDDSSDSNTSNQTGAKTPPAQNGTPPSSGGSDPSSGGSSGSSGNPTTAATWSQIFSSYLASGTPGKCTDCHSEMSDASASYTWLNNKGQIPSIANSSGSCLSWLGGDMPPSGPTSNAKATADLSAWAAAGAKND
jgi:hypothetical protein